MVYYTQEELNVITTEINNLLIDGIVRGIKKFKTTAEFNKATNYKYNVLAISQEIISKYKPVTEETDGVINNITETDLQTIVIKVYEHFFTLKYPKQ